MSYSGDAAEQVVRMSLETGEVAVRLAGSGAKQLAILIYAILREQKKTAGKARLTNMLRSGKELKVFAVKDSDLQLFCREAKKYGVLYCVLKDRDATDGLTDIMARAEDAGKINRIIERFGLATVDMAQVKQEIEQSRVERRMDVPITCFDGEGLISKRYAKVVDRAFCGGTVHTSFQIRLPYIKGMVHQVNFHWILDLCGQKTITDIWGQEHNIKDVDIILTKSMFKGCGWLTGRGGQRRS